MKHFGTLKRFLLGIITLTALVACGQTTTPDQTDPSQDDPRATATNGLTGVYYDNIDFTGTSKTQVDATINKAWAKNTPITGIAASTYSVRWTGQIMPAFSETYTFYVTSSDGARLMVNGQVLVNNWTDHTSTVNSGTVTLQANTKYDIRLEYYRNATNSSVVKLEWQSTSRARQVVPTGNLFPTGYSVPDVIAILQANTTFKATSLVLNPDLTTVSSGSKGKAFESIVEGGISLIFGRIDLSGNVDYLLKYSQNLDTVKFYDLLLKRNVDVGKFSDLINADGTLNTNAKENLVKALARVYLNYDINLSQAISKPVNQTRLVIDSICKQDWIVPPSSGCVSGNCIDLALAYRDAVCTLIGGVGDAVLGAALAGVGPLLTGPAITWKVIGVVLGGSGISGAISTNALGVIANGAFSRNAIEAAWAAYLECIAGKRVVGNVPIPGCPPILDGPNPNPINITDDLGHEGFVAVRWGNKAPVGNGPLAYGFQLQGQGLGISVSLSDTSAARLSPIIQSGTVAAGSSTTRYIWYKCPQIPSTWTGTFTLTHNAPNGAIPVPVTINCIQGIPQINVAPNPISLTASLNSSVTKTLTITNPGTGYLEISGFGITAPWLTASPSGFTGANAIPANSSQNVSVTAKCDAVAETRTGTIGVFHNVPGITNPLLVNVILNCIAKPQLGIIADNTFATIHLYEHALPSFKIANVGDPGSILNYYVELIPYNGTWGFPTTSHRGDSLEQGALPVQYTADIYCTRAGFYKTLTIHVYYETFDANGSPVTEQKTVDVGMKCLPNPAPSMQWSAGLNQFGEGQLLNFNEINQWIVGNCTGSGLNTPGSLAQLEGQQAIVATGSTYDPDPKITTYSASGVFGYRIFGNNPFQTVSFWVQKRASQMGAYAEVSSYLSANWEALKSTCETIPFTW